MEILPSAYYESLKRYWRKRKNQRIYSHGKRKLQIIKLGGKASSSPNRFWRIRRIPKLRWKITPRIKLLSKFHDAYVRMMISLANKMANSSNNGGFLRGKKAAKINRFRWVFLGKKLTAGCFWKSIRS